MARRIRIHDSYGDEQKHGAGPVARPTAKRGGRGGGRGNGRGRGGQKSGRGGKKSGRGRKSSKENDDDPDGRYSTTSASLKLPTGNLRGSKVNLHYAPERGRPSPLLQLQINGAQICQVKIYKFGMPIAMQIARQLFDDVMSETVAIEYVYSWRNQLEAREAQKQALAQASADKVKKQRRG